MPGDTYTGAPLNYTADGIPSSEPAKPTLGYAQTLVDWSDVEESGGGNATVPEDAPIQPPQAFVDAMGQISSGNPSAINLSNLGITSITLGSYSDGPFGIGGILFALGASGTWSLDLSGNAIADVNAILAELAYDQSNSGQQDQTINLSGGTNAAPTGQGLLDKAALISAGWTVTTN